MKKIILLTAILFGFFLSNLNAKTTFYDRDINVNYFFGALEPYGEWIEIGYDEFVWRPNFVDRNWRPYADGRWEWTSNGWYWVSYESFGWATYHYGRWYFDDYYGWVWMPDDVWAPAWVEWRYDDYYIGWAPLPPYARFDRRSGIYFSIKWNSGYNYWNFVKYNHFTSVNIHNYYIYGSKVKNIYTRTKYRTNYYTENNRIVNGGVSRDFVEKRTNRKITTRDINFSDRNFDSKDLRSGKEIREFRPSDNNTSRSSTVDRTKITKGRELKSLNNEKVVIKRSTDKTTTTERTLNKNDEAKSSNTVNREVIKRSTTKENINTDVNKKQK
ncbi:MAG: hypothetical protein H6613_18215 [Ignavibacteriales bacterium]|nr:hypothetical protein [Ignavibacteriales bacterium]